MRAIRSLSLAAVFATACLRAPAMPAVAPSAPGAGSSNSGGVAATEGVPVVAGAGVSGAPGAVGALRHVRASEAPASGSPDSVVSVAEVSRETAKVFGSEAPPPVTDATAATAAPGAPVWDIDVQSYETRARVEDYVRIFSGRAKGVFEVALQRQTHYGPMIRERLRRAGLPEDFTYLALVESWFNPHAYSRAAAVGVWQFMSSTGKGMGLRVDWWMDERRDPVRSTDAAARLLAGLRGQFGSLYLAAAAYNGGSGRVSRGLARYAGKMDGVEGEDRFFALAEQSYLRPETRDYVPKIIAAALVGEEPARYGVKVESLPPYAYDSVRTPGGTPLAAVANALGLGGSDLSEFNPHLLRGMTPPGDSLWVRVPVGSVVNFDERFAALEPDERRALTRLESRKGQTMASIAKSHGLTQKQLAWYNPKVAKLKSGALRAGQTVLVPRRDVVLLARDVPNPSVERYPRRSRTSVRRHKVASGQSLAGIATKYGVSVATLKKLNGLKGDRVMPGQSLVVSRGATAAKKTTTAKPAKAKSSSAKPAKATVKSTTAKSANAKVKSTTAKPAKSKAKSTATKTAKPTAKSKATSAPKTPSR